METEEQSKIGPMFKGQKWVKLNGVFYPAELRDLADKIDENCVGLEKNVS